MLRLEIERGDARPGAQQDRLQGLQRDLGHQLRRSRFEDGNVDLAEGFQALGVAPEGLLRLLASSELLLEVERSLLQLRDEPVAVEPEDFGLFLQLRLSPLGSLLRPLEDGLDPGEERVRLGRLADEVVSADFHREVGVAVLGVGGGVEDEQLVAERVVLPDLSTEPKAVHHRHQDVGDDQVGWLRPRTLQRLFAVRRDVDFVPVPGQ